MDRPGLIVAGAEGKRLTYKQPGLTSLLWRVYAVVTVPRRAAVAWALRTFQSAGVEMIKP